MNDDPGALPRVAARQLLGALARFPVVVVTGARQTGKTTLVTAPPVATVRTFRTLDDLDVLERAERAPDGLVEEAPRLTLDEVQRAPDLLRAVKRSVDRRRVAGRFLLTGSANLLMMRRVSESLAGRAVYLDLWPMNEAEKAGRADAGPWSDWLAAPDASRLQRTIAPARPVADLEKRIRVGGYPVPATTGDRGARTAWFEGYVRTYLERDLQELAAIDSLPDFRRLMRLAALRVGQLVHQTELGRDAGLSQPTVHRWLALLETSFQIVRLAPYAVNRTKRLVKTPKLYWSDTGLAAHLAGEEAPVSGALVENLVLAQLLVWRETVTPRPEILFWRTHTGDEVDLVIEAGPRLLPIEVKSGRRASLDDAKGLEAFLDEYPRAARFGIVLYNGGEVLRLTERIVAAPLAAIW